MSGIQTPIGNQSWSNGREIPKPLKSHAHELSERERFAFGANWKKFLDRMTRDSVVEAIRSLQQMLHVESLTGKSFLDVGCGSGLFSLAARELGALVTSFDYDPMSVACTQRMRDLFRPGDTDWRIDEGSALDEEYTETLGRFDVVYSWGVLHHTGEMWHALRGIARLVKPGGLLLIALYNDQGRRSVGWRRLKVRYNHARAPLRVALLFSSLVRLWWKATLRDFARLKPFHTWRHYKSSRGMSPWRDVVDWVGGLPFEFAKPEEVLRACVGLGFELRDMTTCGGGHGCNEFLFVRKQ